MAVIVSVKVYVVGEEGFAIGFDMLAELKLVVGLHEYVFPATDDAPSVTFTPLQIVVLLPALAAGDGFTVTMTEFDCWHPVAVIVSVRV